MDACIIEGKSYCEVALVEKRLITAEPTIVITKKGQKHNGTLLYTIRPIQEAVEYDYEHRLARFRAEIDRQKVLAKWEKHYGNDRSKNKQEKAYGA